MLAPWMKMGHGVSETIACLDPELATLGIRVSVGCLGHDDHYRRLDLHQVAADPQSVLELAQRVGASAAVALGSPYFEVLPSLAGHLRTMVYEAGDPTPELFGDDAAERRAVAENKRVRVYPHVDVVAAISRFIAHDIGWPGTHVIVQGVDNLPDNGSKPVSPPGSSEKLRIGALTRLGVGEARYKGVAELIGLKGELERLSTPATFELMGRGTPEDAEVFRQHGFVVHLNATEAERNAYLRELDVFVSTSLWEGTNLPLVEAQAQGTPGLALDTGAHPEFTPLMYASVPELAQQIAAYGRDRELLARHGRMAYHFVRSQMVWEHTARDLAGLVQGSPVPRERKGLVNVVRSLRHEGVRSTARKAHRTVRRRVGAASRA